MEIPIPGKIIFILRQRPDAEPLIDKRCHPTCVSTITIPRLQSSWGQHGAHLGPVGPRWAPCWPLEPCYQGLYSLQLAAFNTSSDDRVGYERIMTETERLSCWKLFLSGCTEGCYHNNLWCRQWWKSQQHDDLVRVNDFILYSNDWSSFLITISKFLVVLCSICRGKTSRHHWYLVYICHHLCMNWWYNICLSMVVW